MPCELLWGHNKPDSMIEIVMSKAGVNGYTMLIIRYEQPLLVDCS